MKEMMKISASSLINEDSEMATILSEVEMITQAEFNRLLSFIVGKKAKSTRNSWSMVSKMKLRPEVCDAKDNDASELAKADAALKNLISHKSSKEVDVKSVQKPLETLGMSIQGLEDDLETIFRRFIKTRVSLLNILNQ
ncbi:hypothetical protein IFM89_022956 [Coptis chinensis]|uniref:Uncharacterized protein n=1 Tax=Coptis chinensis TaxID=261450 RepID=A0A835HPF9_9MAGN|nr:hypothetical protein IFM89_022956 [Coptis chinensis]